MELVQESSIIQHKIMIPYGIQGEIEEIGKGKFTVTETITKIRDRQGLLQEIKMLQKWPVRISRPLKKNYRLLNHL